MLLHRTQYDIITWRFCEPVLSCYLEDSTSDAAELLGLPLSQVLPIGVAVALSEEDELWTWEQLEGGAAPRSRGRKASRVSRDTQLK